MKILNAANVVGFLVIMAFIGLGVFISSVGEIKQVETINVSNDLVVTSVTTKKGEVIEVSGISYDQALVLIDSKDQLKIQTTNWGKCTKIYSTKFEYVVCKN